MNLYHHSGRFSGLLIAAAMMLGGCADQATPNDSTPPSAKAQRIAAMKQVTDQHSFARPNEARITHLNWNARIDFDARTISGTATYDIETAADAQRIVFDTHELTIENVTVDGQPSEFSLGDAQRQGPVPLYTKSGHPCPHLDSCSGQSRNPLLL